MPWPLITIIDNALAYKCRYGLLCETLVCVPEHTICIYLSWIINRQNCFKSGCNIYMYTCTHTYTLLCQCKPYLSVNRTLPINAVLVFTPTCTCKYVHVHVLRALRSMHSKTDSIDHQVYFLVINCKGVP